MIHQMSIYGKDKVQTAVERLQAFEPDDGYYLAFSGGKDSVVIKALADMAGVKYDAHYALTSVDPPELVRFIKDKYSDVVFEIPKDKDGNRITMWNLIPRKKMPPTRMARYCCKALKEWGGVRAADRYGRPLGRKREPAKESGRGDSHATREETGRRVGRQRKFFANSSGGVVLNNDNEDSRKMVEQCYRLSKAVLNPIIDWTDADVWEFIREYNVPYCKLYDQGWKRIGCIGCPMGNNGEELEKFPKYKQAYLRAFERMLKNLDGNITSWRDENGEPSAQAVYDWWVKPIEKRKV